MGKWEKKRRKRGLPPSTTFSQKNGVRVGNEERGEGERKKEKGTSFACANIERTGRKKGEMGRKDFNGKE